jgi:hypothetical protein
MAPSWDAFFTDEQIIIPNDQWFDIPGTTTDHLPEMPKSTTSGKAGSRVDDFNSFDSILGGTAFDDPLFNTDDYFVSDFECLQSFDGILGSETTSDSSPEPSSGFASMKPLSKNELSPASQTPDLTSINQWPQMLNVSRPFVPRARSHPSPADELLFPNTLDENIAPSPNGKTFKRSKLRTPDILSSCGTSPLCPNHDQDGLPPNPSTCGGECAPFLFASEDALPVSTDPLLPEQEVMAEDGVVEIQPRRKKRSESNTSSSTPVGRQFLDRTVSESVVPQTKMDKSVSPEQVPTVDDGKPTTRRRLPHNQVERKYRESLNAQLESLRRVVPALQQNQRACDGTDIEDLPTPSKPSKAVILASAAAHIKQVEKDKKALQDENEMLRTKLKALQSLVKCEDCNLMQYVMDLKINQQR